MDKQGICDNIQTPLAVEAEVAATQDRELRTLSAIRLYRKAIGWDLLVSGALIMTDHDGKLMATFYAEPLFQQRYGVQQCDGSYQIPAP